MLVDLYRSTHIHIFTGTHSKGYLLQQQQSICIFNRLHNRKLLVQFSDMNCLGLCEIQGTICDTVHVPHCSLSLQAASSSLHFQKR